MQLWAKIFFAPKISTCLIHLSFPKSWWSTRVNQRCYIPGARKGGGGNEVTRRRSRFRSRWEFAWLVCESRFFFYSIVLDFLFKEITLKGFFASKGLSILRESCRTFFGNSKKHSRTVEKYFFKRKKSILANEGRGSFTNKRIWLSWFILLQISWFLSTVYDG